MSARLAGRSLVDEVEEQGGQANASSGNEATLYYARVANEDVPAVLRRMWTAIDTPPIGRADLKRERAVVLQELAAAAADPGDVVQDAFLADLFPGHPLGRPVGGLAADIDRIAFENVVAYQERSSSADRVFLSVVGGADERIVRDAVPDAVLAHRDTPPVPVAPPPMREVSDELRWSTTHDFTWVAVGGPGVARTSPDRYGFQVLSHLLGGSPASVLYRTLRDERGLAYAFQSWFSGYRDAGAWRVLAGVQTANAPEVIAVVTGLLQDVAVNGPAGKDLDVARRQAAGTLLRDREDPVQHAIDRVLALDAGQGHGTDEDELAGLAAVTGADLSRCARHVLDALTVTARPMGEP
jgi:predicted Zn-dependent peptidase